MYEFFLFPDITSVYLNLSGRWGIGHWCNGQIKCIRVGELHSSHRSWPGLNAFSYLQNQKACTNTPRLNLSLFFSVEQPAVLSQWDWSSDASRVELISHQPPVWCGEPLAHLGVCPCYSGPGPLGHQLLQLPAAGAPAQTLPHCPQLCLDVCLHPPATTVSTSWHQVCCFNQASLFSVCLCIIVIECVFVIVGVFIIDQL